MRVALAFVLVAAQEPLLINHLNFCIGQFDTILDQTDATDNISGRIDEEVNTVGYAKFNAICNNVGHTYADTP